ncbi:riboflavin synthase [Altericista sp. CCNU0014]|uniref:riboflavin synthase n=1 Tax=Altericista sp. CCNU0014 TaxID=3082949 RepID=UPI00384F1B85
MFTGLIQASGSLESLSPRQLLVRCKDAAFVKALAVGDSVAVDGACLTVETLADSGFAVAISPETLRRTTLERAMDTDWVVNLEPALRVGDRLGGHFVAGHVDGMGRVEALDRSAESWEMHFTVPPELGRYLLSKGSVAINGVSLTIANCTDDGTQFVVAVIPHSFANTNLQYLSPRQAVNIETDLLGKYVAKLLRLPSGPAAPQADIDLNFLAEHGFA